MNFSAGLYGLRQPAARQSNMSKKIVPRLKVSGPRHFIREWREHRGLTQEQLAERVEMSVSSISQLENGKQGYRQATLEVLAEALRCEPGDLLIRNPLDGDAVWTIWEKLKPAQRRQASRLLQTFAETDDSAAA